MKTIQEFAEWHGKNRYGRTFARLTPHQQITVLLDVLGRAHMQRDKFNSHGTKKARAYISHMTINDLKDAGHHIKNLLNLDERHICAVLEVWMGQRLSASTMATRVSILRWMAAALGKRGLVRDPVQYGFPAEATHRPQATTEDKSWSGSGHDPDTQIKFISNLDNWVGIQLEMCWAFGLRLTEALLIKPRASHVGDSLRVEEGTKGGRTRIVPIETDRQRHLLERAKTMADQSARGNLVPPRLTPAQARQRVYYICRRRGITKDLMGITPHGLRHQYANDRYEEVSGTPSAVRGSTEILDPCAEKDALHTVTNELGHARLGVAASYLGPRKRIGASGKRTPNHPSPAVWWPRASSAEDQD